MARIKRNQVDAAAASVAAAATEVAIPLSAKVKKLIDTVRQPFTSLVSDFAALTIRRADFAPVFMRACTAWQSETGGKFADFVRVLDPTIGKKRAEYRKHPSYAMADNLRRLAGKAATGEGAAADGPAGASADAGESSASILDGLSRTLAAFLPIIGADQIETLWGAFKEELHWTDRRVKQLQNMTTVAEPLLRLRAPRGSGGIPAMTLVRTHHKPGPVAQAADMSAPATVTRRPRMPRTAMGHV